MDAAALSQFHSNLKRWYAAHGRRDLPWRTTRDPYAIYISEVMLQQTQVATVLARYYHPFLQRFPTLSALAAASRDEVMKAWQGLGYYSRAANLHNAAIQSKGTLPRTVEGLLALPGIGRNTAHAVAAFAYQLPVAVMEANVARVLCRIHAMRTPTPALLWEKAAELLDHAHVFDYNQAMMDIGAMVCRKRDPLCSECPASAICQGKNAPAEFPAPKPKKVPPVRHHAIVVWQNQRGEYHATARRSRFLGGLYRFDERPASQPPAHGATLLGHVRQQYSHFTLEADIYLARKSARSRTGWHRPEALERLPLSMAEQKILTLLKAHGHWA